mgnify:CR=1 FL=1|jgi:hypothetical protein
MEVVKVESIFVVGGIEGVGVEFDNKRYARFLLYGVQFFNDNGVPVSGKIMQICEKRRGCMVELRSLGKITGEKRFFAFTDVVIARVGDKVLTQDGIGTIAEASSYSDFSRYGVKFDKIPARFASLVEAGYFKNGLLYYNGNEVDLVKGV